MEIVGWSASLVLAVTLIHQIYRQWKDNSAEGVSVWLFVGQALANVGFLIYSVHQRDWVFCFTNGLLLITNLVGYLLTLRQHKEEHAAV